MKSFSIAAHGHTSLTKHASGDKHKALGLQVLIKAKLLSSLYRQQHHQQQVQPKVEKSLLAHQ